MRPQLLHVFRNTPFGRETLLSSAYFCKRAGADLQIFIPEFPQFLMYFDSSVATVDLDRAFLRSPETAREHVEAIMSDFGVSYSYFEPIHFTASMLPDVPTDFDFMCCPRSISNLSTRISLGYIGPRVRNIVQQARFPVLIPTPVFKRWDSIVCFFGGSTNSINAARYALRLQRAADVPVHLFTQGHRKGQEHYREQLSSSGLLKQFEESGGQWLFFDKRPFIENLYAVPQDALAIAGAYGHGLAKELFFGGTLETIQSVLPSPIMIVGPQCQPN